MGIKMKLLKLHMNILPWCFQVMAGNHHHHHHHRVTAGDNNLKDHHHHKSSAGIINLIMWDGVVKTYNNPIHVSQLTLEFPKHLVCRSDSLYIGQKIPPLSDHDKLELGHDYFLLPNHFFQSVLSFVTIATSFASAGAGKNAFVKKAANCQPFDIQKTATGCLRIRVSGEFISQLILEQQAVATGKIPIRNDEDIVDSKCRLCTTPQLHKDYTQLVRSSSRQWKPKLDTIKEQTRERRKLSTSSFGMKRYRSKNKKSQSSTSSSSKSRGYLRFSLIRSKNVKVRSRI
ncbi:hypothetical protein UlMin_044507 [Ulmus minor]